MHFRVRHPQPRRLSTRQLKALLQQQPHPATLVQLQLAAPWIELDTLKQLMQRALEAAATADDAAAFAQLVRDGVVITDDD